jgi:hypothetical protein
MKIGKPAQMGLWRHGQVMIEYAMVAGILLACVAVLAIFLYTFREYGDRVINLVASEYP